MKRVGSCRQRPSAACRACYRVRVASTSSGFGFAVVPDAFTQYLAEAWAFDVLGTTFEAQCFEGATQSVGRHLVRFDLVRGGTILGEANFISMCSSSTVMVRGRSADQGQLRLRERVFATEIASVRVDQVMHPPGPRAAAIDRGQQPQGVSDSTAIGFRSKLNASPILG